MPIFLRLLPYLAALAAVAAILTGTWWHGHEAGAARVQAAWNADKKVQLEALAAQQARVIETERAHAQLAQRYNDTWSADLPAIRNRWLRDHGQDLADLARSLSAAAATSGTADAAAADNVPADAFRKLAADCAETTGQLVRLQEWARER